MEQKDLPAFPVVATNWHHKGMTLRDYFAAAALTGMLSGNDANADDDVVAKCAYDLADAMLKAREVKP